MFKEVIETGKTVEAAIESACDKLGCEREDCEWEIIDLPKRGFLGLKNIPAKVKVSTGTPEEVPPPIAAVEKKAVISQDKPKPPKEAPKEKKIQKEPRLQKEAPKEPKEQKPPEKPAETRKKEPKPQQQQKHQSKGARFADQDEPVKRELVTEGFTEKETLVLRYIDSILKDFGLNVRLVLYRENNGICVNIVGEGLGAIIGRRGENLDAIQYLSGLVANRAEGDYLRVAVDCGDYREKRKETLEALTRKLAAQVLRTNISKALEPMNPFERRVIHATVSKIEGVTSSSVGDEPNRRVIITSPTARRAPSREFFREGSGRGQDRGSDKGSGRRQFRDNDRGGYGGKRNQDRRRPPRNETKPVQDSSAPPEPPKQTPEAVAGGGLYEKIDLE